MGSSRSDMRTRASDAASTTGCAILTVPSEAGGGCLAIFSIFRESPIDWSSFASCQGPKGHSNCCKQATEVSLDGKRAQFSREGTRTRDEETQAQGGAGGMSLYPPRTVVGIRATRRRDIPRNDGGTGRTSWTAGRSPTPFAPRNSASLSAAFERDPPSTFAPYRKTRSAVARVAVRKGVPRRHVRRLHARAQGSGRRPGSSMRTEITSRWCRARLRGGRLRSPRWRRARPARP